LVDWLQNGLGAIHLASKEGHIDIVSELLSRGVDVNTATNVMLSFLYSPVVNSLVVLLFWLLCLCLHEGGGAELSASLICLSVCLSQHVDVDGFD